MINDRQLLEHFQGTDQSIDSLREAILTLHRQNLDLLRIIAKMEKQIQLQHWTPGGPALDGLPLYLASFFVRKGKDGP